MSAFEERAEPVQVEVGNAVATVFNARREGFRRITERRLRRTQNVGRGRTHHEAGINRCSLCDRQADRHPMARRGGRNRQQARPRTGRVGDNDRLAP